MGGHGIRFRPFADVHRAVHPVVHFTNVPDRTRLDQFHHPPVVAARADLVAHLGDAPAAPGEFGQPAGFGDGAGQRFFAVHVPASPEGRRDDDGMGVIRSADHHAVEIVTLQQFAVVRVERRRGMALGRGRQAERIDIAEGDDVLAADGLEVLSAPPRPATPMAPRFRRSFGPGRRAPLEERQAVKTTPAAAVAVAARNERRLEGPA